MAPMVATQVYRWISSNVSPPVWTWSSDRRSLPPDCWWAARPGRAQGPSVLTRRVRRGYSPPTALILPVRTSVTPDLHAVAAQTKGFLPEDEAAALHEAALSAAPGL